MLTFCLEARLGKYVSANHALVPWLLQHTCILLNAKSRGSDGLTCWERIKGRMFNQLLLGFAEAVLYKLPTSAPTQMAIWVRGGWKERFWDLAGPPTRTW